MIYGPAYVGTTANRITFNGTDSPIFRAISQAPQPRQLRELDIPIPFESGISDFETLVGKVIYPIDGTMYVSVGSESEYDTGRRALRKLASLDVSQADNLSDMGYVPFAWTDFSGMKQVFLKVLYVQMIEDTRKGLVQPFRLICKVKDPTIHGTSLKTADTSSSDPTTASGTGIYAFSYPIIFGASTYSVSNTINNEGEIDAYPQTIVVRGPVNVPKITNVTTGEYIQVDVNLATTSNFLRINYDKDTLSVEVDGVSEIDEVTTLSTYFKIQPGENEISLTGSSIGSGAYVQLSAYDAWPLG